jgi:hypothetical protein
MYKICAILYIKRPTLYTLPNLLKLPNFPKCRDLILAKATTFAKAFFEKNDIRLAKYEYCNEQVWRLLRE